jgi:hypothetical protein
VNIYSSYNDVTIRNGIVRDWSSYGVIEGGYTGSPTRMVTIEDLHVSNCGSSTSDTLTGGGIGRSHMTEAQIVNCIVEDCYGDGINLGGNSIVTGCIARNNMRSGIYAGPQSVVSECAAIDNANTGIYADYGSTMSGCSSSGNKAHGIIIATAVWS